MTTPTRQATPARDEAIEVILPVTARSEEDDELRAHPLRDTVIDAIIAETGCNQERAELLLDLLDDAVRAMRRVSYYMYHFNDYELELHDLLELIMPDDQHAVPGSAHALVEAHLLEGDELYLMHTRDRSRGVVNCAVTLELHRVS